MASSSQRDRTGEAGFDDVETDASTGISEITEKMCYEDGDKEQKTTSDKAKSKKHKKEVQEKEAEAAEASGESKTAQDAEDTEEAGAPCPTIELCQNVISTKSDLVSVTEKTEFSIKASLPKEAGSISEKSMNNSQSGDSATQKGVPQERKPTDLTYSRTKAFGPNHVISQGQIDSYTARVLAMEKSLGNNNENRVEQSATATATATAIEPVFPYQIIGVDPTRARSPSVPNTLTLGIPRDLDEYRFGLLDDTSPSSSRRALSPLLEVRRPHCTLNCENCKTILEERFRHSRFHQVKGMLPIGLTRSFIFSKAINTFVIFLFFFLLFFKKKLFYSRKNIWKQTKKRMLKYICWLFVFVKFK